MDSEPKLPFKSTFEAKERLRLERIAATCGVCRAVVNRGTREGKLKVVRIGIHGSKKQACGEALSCSSAVARSQTSQRTELRATTAPTTPNVVESMLDYTFWCFPHASPALTSGAGKRRTAPKDHSKSLTCLRKIGAGEGIRTLDPNLGKVVLYP